MWPLHAASLGEHISLDSYIRVGRYRSMNVYEALAEPHRRRIIELVGERDRTAGEIVEALGISQPGASQHLKALRDAGLVTVRKDAQRRLYSLQPEKLVEVDA